MKEVALLILIGIASLGVAYAGLTFAAADLRKHHHDTPCIGAAA